VIWRLTGVSYHPGHVWWLLRRHHWSPSAPLGARLSATRTPSPGGAPRTGRDQGGALRRGAWICFVDESGASLVPPVRRTWAPRGHTPILRHRMRGRKRISMAGVCCYRPDPSDARLAFHLREGAYDTDQLIPIVAALGRLVGGNAPVILVWDNLPAITASRWGLAGQPARLAPGRVPARLRPRPGPGGGPVGQLKDVELANRACGSLEELAAAAEQGIGRVRGEPELLFSFLHQAGLSL
jgi:hypothetical protein